MSTLYSRLGLEETGKRGHNCPEKSISHSVEIHWNMGPHRECILVRLHYWYVSTQMMISYMCVHPIKLAHLCVHPIGLSTHTQNCPSYRMSSHRMIILPNVHPIENIILSCQNLIVYQFIPILCQFLVHSVRILLWWHLSIVSETRLSKFVMLLSHCININARGVS